MRSAFRRDRAGVRAAIVAKKRGNARGAKGGRKRNHMGQLGPFKKHNRLLNELKLCGQTSLGEAKALLWCVGTARAGEGNPASPRSLWSGVRRNSGNRGVGKFATGEPDAGDPQVRFGGGSETNQCLVPTSIKPRAAAHHPRSCRNAALRLKLGTPRAWRSLPGIHEAINGKCCTEHHLP